MSNTEVVEPSALSVIEPVRALADIREQAMSVPVETMRQGLAEYANRRKTFREWIMEQLIEGVHYAYAPGCVPKWADAEKRPCERAAAVYVKGYNWKKKEETFTPLSQWVPKQSLLKAGAEFMVDLMQLRAEYSSDEATRACLGAKEGVFVIRCRLFSKANGQFLGEGLGARKVGEKDMSENASLKMAQKAAMVCAVLNTYGLSDLFTQDMEDVGEEPPPNESPPPNAKAPKANARNARLQPAFAETEVKRLKKRWLTLFGDGEVDKDKLTTRWNGWLETTTGKSSLSDSKQWTAADVDICDAALTKAGEA